MYVSRVTGEKAQLTEQLEFPVSHIYLWVNGTVDLRKGLWFLCLHHSSESECSFILSLL